MVFLTERKAGFKVERDEKQGPDRLSNSNRKKIQKNAEINRVTNRKDRVMDLSLVPLSEIYKELDKRLPNHVLLSIRPGQGPETVQVKLSGSATMCLGMMDAVSNKLRNSMSFFGGIPED